MKFFNNIFTKAKRHNPGVYVLAYHHLSTEVERDKMQMGELFSDKISTSDVAFKKQIDYLVNERYEFVSLDKAIDVLKSGLIDGKRYVAITFDDGFKSVISTALPLLKEIGAPGFGFVNACMLLDNKPIPRFILSYLLSKNPEMVIKKFNEHFSLRFKRPLDLFNYYKNLYETRFDTLLNELYAEYNGSHEEVFFKLEEYNLTKKKFDFLLGSHTHSHVRLSRISWEEQRQEIVDCHNRLETELGCRVKHFAYPFGGKEHFNNDSKTIVRNQLGEVSGFSAYGGVNITYSKDNVFRIPVGNQVGRDFERLLVAGKK